MRFHRGPSNRISHFPSPEHWWRLTTQQLTLCRVAAVVPPDPSFSIYLVYESYTFASSKLA